MRRTVLCPFLASVFLLGASSLAFGRDVSPSGDTGDCRDSVITVPSPAQSHAPAAKHPAPVHKARPTTTVHSTGGGGGDDSAGAPRVPRWHSFLPGMFR
jgi:hypothetical protein